jgi:hypothetical protein
MSEVALRLQRLKAERCRANRRIAKAFNRLITGPDSGKLALREPNGDFLVKVER